MDNYENNNEEYEEYGEAVDETADGSEYAEDEELYSSPAKNRGKTIGIIVGAIAGVAVLVAGVILAITLGGGNNGGDEEEDMPHTHAFGNNWTVVKEATCTEDGERVCYCACGEKQSKVIKASHTEVVDKAVEATCQTKGLTEGRHCSVCGEVLVEQKEINYSNHKYDNDKDANCNICGLLRDVSCKHNRTETIPGREATCTDDGLTEGRKCTDCGEIVVERQVIRAGHKVVIDEAIQATCQSTGLTEGSHCSECGAVIKSQQMTEITPCIFLNGEYIDTSKVYDTSYKDIKCFADLPFVCGEETLGYVSCHHCRTIVVLNVNVVHEYDRDGVCTRCGEHQ